MPLPTALDRSNYSRKQTLDIRSAMARAIARQVAGWQYPDGTGQVLEFADVFEEWPSPEDSFRMPGTACVLPSAYPMDASQMTPSLLECTWEPAGMPGFALYSVAEVVADFDIQIKAATVAERQAFITGLESMWIADDGLMDFQDGPRYGRILPLPEYWGLEGVFSLKNIRLLDDEDAAMRNVREAVITVTGQSAQVVLRPVQPLKLTVRIKECVNGQES